MATLETLAIHSPKDRRQRWIINLSDYDPHRHHLWGTLESDDEKRETQNANKEVPQQEEIRLTPRRGRPRKTEGGSL